MPKSVYTLPDGRRIEEGQPFAIAGAGKFPANWLKFATPEDLARAKITVEVVADPEPPAPPAPAPRTWKDVQSEAERALNVVHRKAMRDLIAGRVVDAAIVQRAAELYAILDAETGDPGTVIEAEKARG